MAGAPVDICNLALGHLRQSAIQDLGERSPEARDCKRYYDDAIRAALRLYDWPFARFYTVGVAVTGALKPGWLYKYAYPDGCLYLRQIATDRRLPPQAFEISHDGTLAARVIHCNAPAPTFIYTGYVSDVALYDQAFVMAASYELAALLAMPRTGKASLMDAMRKMAAQATAEARAEAANEEPNKVNDQTPPDWIRGRGVGFCRELEAPVSDYPGAGLIVYLP